MPQPNRELTWELPLLVAGLLLLVPGMTVAQQSSDREPLAADRPDFTESSSTVGKGVYQLEFGYSWSRDEQFIDYSWGEPLLRAGILVDWLELRVGAAPIRRKDRASSFSESGLEDLYVGTKIYLVAQNSVVPEAAVILQMTVPLGSAAFTNEELLPGVNLIYAWTLTENLGLAGSTQVNVSVDSEKNRYNEWAQSVVLGSGLTEKIGSYLEWYAMIPDDPGDTSAQHFLNGGFTWSVTPDLQLDVRIGTGLGELSGTTFFGTGASVRFR